MNKELLLSMGFAQNPNWSEEIQLKVGHLLFLTFHEETGFYLETRRHKCDTVIDSIPLGMLVEDKLNKLLEVLA